MNRSNWAHPSALRARRGIARWSPPQGAIDRIAPGGGSAAVFATLPTGVVPFGLAFNSSGDLFVGDFEHGTIYRVTPGALVTPFATLPTNSGPIGLAFDSAGFPYAGGTDAPIRASTRLGGFAGINRGLISPAFRL